MQANMADTVLMKKSQKQYKRMLPDAKHQAWMNHQAHSVKIYSCSQYRIEHLLLERLLLTSVIWMMLSSTAVD